MSDDQEEVVGDLRRFDVDVFIKHPTMKFEEISTELGIRPHFAHSVGDKKISPNGVVRPGTWPDTRWRRSNGFETNGQHFATKSNWWWTVSCPTNRFLIGCAQPAARLT